MDIFSVYALFELHSKLEQESFEQLKGEFMDLLANNKPLQATALIQETHDDI